MSKFDRDQMTEEHDLKRAIGFDAKAGSLRICSLTRAVIDTMYVKLDSIKLNRFTRR